MTDSATPEQITHEQSLARMVPLFRFLEAVGSLTSDALRLDIPTPQVIRELQLQLAILEATLSTLG